MESEDVDALSASCVDFFLSHNGFNVAFFQSNQCLKILVAVAPNESAISVNPIRFEA